MSGRESIEWDDADMNKYIGWKKDIGLGDDNDNLHYIFFENFFHAYKAMSN